ncbi:hypothetical protein RBH85_01265 [Streptomyces rochei]|nr:hypothetical protein [Streptomyces rochei]WMI55562.1 hypothetical protein RBH85_01265 [Streptomyces rochei]
MVRASRCRPESQHPVLPVAVEAHDVPTEGVSSATLTARQRRLAGLGRALLRSAAGPDAPLAVTALPEDDAVVVAHSVRGGGRVYVAGDESVLFAGSAAPPHEALEVFRSGRRTPLHHFRPVGAPDKRPVASPPGAHSATALLDDEARAPALAALLAEESATHVWPARDGVVLQVGDMEIDWTVRRADRGFTLTRRERGREETTRAMHYGDLTRLLLLALSPLYYRIPRPRLTRFDVEPDITLGGSVRSPEVSWRCDGQRHQVRGPALSRLLLPFAKLCRGTWEEIHHSLLDAAGLPLLGKRTTDSLTVPLDREHLPQIARWLADVSCDWYDAPGTYDVYEPLHLPGQIIALGVAGEAELTLVEHDGEVTLHDRIGEIFRTTVLEEAVRALAVEWLTTPHARPRPPRPTPAQRTARFERFAGHSLDDIERALARQHPTA